MLYYDEEGNPSFGYKLPMNGLCNDRWIDSYMQRLIEIWMANMDFQLVVDVNKVIAYMTKYVTKPEIEISSNMNKMIVQIINKSHVDGLTTKAILKNDSALMIVYNIIEGIFPMNKDVK